MVENAGWGANFMDSNSISVTFNTWLSHGDITTCPTITWKARSGEHLEECLNNNEYASDAHPTSTGELLLYNEKKVS